MKNKHNNKSKNTILSSLHFYVSMQPSPMFAGTQSARIQQQIGGYAWLRDDIILQCKHIVNKTWMVTVQSVLHTAFNIM